jgi:hypothetical protein
MDGGGVSDTAHMGRGRSIRPSEDWRSAGEQGDSEKSPARLGPAVLLDRTISSRILPKWLVSPGSVTASISRSVCRLREAARCTH